VRERIRTSLEQLAAAAAGTGRIRGKRVKTIRGQADTFHRLRVGDHRVMYDLVNENRVLLVLAAGITIFEPVGCQNSDRSSEWARPVGKTGFCHRR
jgi:mRNA-degrading endonuclease RelE of RelBE toxin-antitoxin system